MLKNSEHWLARHQRLVLAALVLASLLVRAGYFLELNRGPGMWQYRWDQSDMNFFDTWARDLAGGDWLTDKPLHPVHQWQRLIAADYFRLYPEAAGALLEQGAPSPVPADPARLLWNHWYGGKAFHQEPLYPYLVALTYKAFGPEVRWVFGWQMLLGVGSNLLIYLIARRRFGLVAAAVAGALAVLCGPLLFYELSLLRETLITFMWLGLVCLTDLALARGDWRWWGLTGLGCGLGVLLKITFFPFFLGVLVILVLHYRAAPRVLVRTAAALAGGLVICLLPVLARNLAVGVPALTLQSVAAITFINANAAGFSPGEGFFVSKHAAAIMAHTDGAFSPAVIETVKTHANLWSLLKMLGAKFAAVWHWYEVPNNQNFYYFRLHSRILRDLPVTFLILAPLSLVGLALAAGGRIPCWPLYLAVAVNLGFLLLADVFSRLRIPLVALLIPFAALTTVRLLDWLRTGRAARAAAAMAALVLLSLWTMRPLPEQRPLIRGVDYCVPYGAYYYPVAEKALTEGDWPRVVNILADSLRYEPEVVKEMGVSRAAGNEEETLLAGFFARVHQQYAQALLRAGQQDAALEEAERAAALRQAAQGQSRQ
ncbi:MAG: glycosyltransferase family 39 protein [Desulfobaccales bacterium]